MVIAIAHHIWKVSGISLETPMAYSFLIPHWEARSFQDCIKDLSRWGVNIVRDIFWQARRMKFVLFFSCFYPLYNSNEIRTRPSVGCALPLQPYQLYTPFSPKCLTRKNGLGFPPLDLYYEDIRNWKRRKLIDGGEGDLSHFHVRKHSSQSSGRIYSNVLTADRNRPRARVWAGVPSPGLCQALNVTWGSSQAWTGGPQIGCSCKITFILPGYSDVKHH